MNVSELKDYLGCSRATVYKLIRTKGFPSARIGKCVIIPVAALQEWLKNGGTEEIKRGESNG